MWIALTRDVSRTLADCELSYVDREPIDIERAQHQHEAYRHALESCGCGVIALPAENALPDAVFVEDVALVLDEIAISTRPGAESRRGEVASVARELGRFRTLRTIEPPGTLDGGDVLCIGRTIYVGESARSNANGVAQLRALVGATALGGQGYTVQTVPIRGCLHLKSAVTEVADGVVLIQPDWVDRRRVRRVSPHRGRSGRAARGKRSSHRRTRDLSGLVPADATPTCRRRRCARGRRRLGAAEGRRRRHLLQHRVPRARRGLRDCVLSSAPSDRAQRRGCTMNESMLMIPCPHCGAMNRVPDARLAEAPVCGRCHQAVFTGKPIALDRRGF